MDRANFTIYRVLRRLVSGCAMLALGSSLAGAGPVDSLEYRVKAAFLFNFGKFVEWPSAATASTNAPIVIGVLGEDPFGGILEQTVEGKTIQDRPLQISRADTVDRLEQCHMLFISRSKKDRHSDILGRLKGRPVLTISEFEGFIDGGGMINFIMKENKVRFEINARAAERAGLKVSSKLLRLATRIVNGNGQGQHEGRTDARAESPRR